jgi:hypothetical protein
MRSTLVVGFLFDWIRNLKFWGIKLLAKSGSQLTRNNYGSLRLESLYGSADIICKYLESF